MLVPWRVNVNLHSPFNHITPNDKPGLCDGAACGLFIGAEFDVTSCSSFYRNGARKEERGPGHIYTGVSENSGFPPKSSHF